MPHIHIKVRWAALGGALAAVLTALAPAVGVHYGATLAAVLTALAASLGGYAAPAPALAPQGVDADA